MRGPRGGAPGIFSIRPHDPGRGPVLIRLLRPAPGVVEVGICFHAEQYGGARVVELREVLALYLLAIAKRNPCLHSAVVIEKRIDAVTLAFRKLLLGRQDSINPVSTGAMRNAISQFLQTGPTRRIKEFVSGVNVESIIEVCTSAIFHHLSPLIIPGVVDDQRFVLEKFGLEPGCAILEELIPPQADEF